MNLSELILQDEFPMAFNIEVLTEVSIWTWLPKHLTDQMRLHPLWVMSQIDGFSWNSSKEEKEKYYSRCKSYVEPYLRMKWHTWWLECEFANV